MDNFIKLDSGYAHISTVAFWKFDKDGNRIAFDKEDNKLGIITQDVSKVILNIVPAEGWESVSLWKNGEGGIVLSVEPIIAFAYTMDGFLRPLIPSTSSFEFDSIPTGWRKTGQNDNIFTGDGEYTEKGFMETFSRDVT